jgi:RNA polymerase sigma factor (sigma-70 family)
MPGENADLVDLYQREWSPLLRTAYALVGSRPTAEEIVQDAFVALQATRTAVLNPGAYLRRSVINGCHSTHRHNAVVSRTAIPVQGPAIDHHDELGDALRALPWRQQAALVLRYHLDLTETDIAEALSCRPSTVRSIIKRGLDTLRKEIDS